MDATAATAAGKFIEQGLLGSAVVALVIALCLCIRHIVKLYAEKTKDAKEANDEKDAIRVQQINDTRIALEAVSKSTDNLANAEERMMEQTALLKEWVIISRSQQGKGS